ncbi:MAG: PAS domain S-box protein [Limisphaerales bacterium]
MPPDKTDVVNILLVDDEVRNLDVLESILASPKHHLVRAQAAQEALMALIDGEFAAIILDIQMPGTNGLELAHLIKQRKRTQHIPIIFLTAYFQEDKDVIQGYEIGAVDYLTKPIDSKILKSKIAVFVELFQKNRELAALNREMENEIAQRQKAEEALRQVNSELEARVQERIAAHADLTRQKEAQTRLYDATLSSMTDLAYTFDLEGNWIYANKPLLQIWGKSLKEITGKSSLELGYPPELAERLKQQVKEVVETRQPVSGETYYTDAAGVEDYHEYIFSPVLAADGTVTAVCGTTRLTTERKRAESLLRQNEALFSALVDQAPNGVYVVDAQFRLQQINARALPAFENVHPQIGRDFSEVMKILWGPEVGGEIVKIFRHTLATGERYISPRFSEIRQDLGEEKSYEWETQRVTLPDGQHGVVCYFSDVTEQRREAKASQQLAAIVESSADAIISKDVNGVITSWNQGAERLFGYPAAEVIGRPVTILIPQDHLDEEPKILERIRRGERIEHYETIRQRKDGKLIEISLTVSPIQDAKGKVIGASKIARDVTEQKQAERELEHAHKEAVAASRAKDDFLAALSHELRTPLNPVLLVASDGAGNPHLPEATRKDFEMIRKNIELEARLIDDLLDLTRISRGKLSLEKSPVDLRIVLQDALAIVEPDVKAKQISLTLALGTGKAMVLGDAVRLQQVLWNVLKNAVKFTPTGGRITVEILTLAESGNIAVKVVDSGIGLTIAEITHIFNAFSQGDHAEGSGSHRFGGLGLGLAISRMLVKLHSGIIHAASAGRGEGAVFTVELPSLQLDKENYASVTPKIADHSTPPVKKAGLRILLIEDHEPTRTALAHLLTRREYKVKTATSVADAQALAGQETFDLVISDIGLPDGDGYTLMAELRDRFGLKGVALTGYGMDQDIERTLAAGFVVHLTKPVHVQSLEKALADPTLVNRPAVGPV